MKKVSVCPKCGSTNRMRVHGGAHTQCRDCHNARSRIRKARNRKQKSDPWNRAQINLDRLRDDYCARRPVVEIAREYGVTINTIYARLQQLGITRTNSESHAGLQVGDRNPNWQGGRSRDAAGYITLRFNGKEIREHRVIAERLIGRPLSNEEVVHHKNGNRADNRPENIEICQSHSEHMKKHMTHEDASRRGKNGAIRRWSTRKAVGVEVAA